MWLLLSSRMQLMLIVGATVLAVWATQGVAAMFTGAAVSPLGLVSPIVFFLGTVVVVILNQFWRPLWRLVPTLSRVMFPDLNGTWRGTVETTWVDSDGVSPGPIDVTIWVRQSLFAIRVQQRTNESGSWSQRVFPEADGEAGRFGLWYSYSNQPKATVSKTSAPHEGVARLELSWSAGEACLSGRYFTARETTGDINVVRVSKEIIEP